jgi:hypothetical protein
MAAHVDRAQNTTTDRPSSYSMQVEIANDGWNMLQKNVLPKNVGVDKSHRAQLRICLLD